MKIKKEEFLALHFREKYSKMIETYHNNTNNINIDLPDNMTMEEFMENRVEKFDQILSEKDNEFYLLTNPVKEISSKIKVGDNFNYNLLNTIDEKKCTYIPDKNRFFRYRIAEGSLHVLYVTIDPVTYYLQYNSFRVDIENNKVYNAGEQSFVILEELVKYLIFVELSEVELKLVRPNGKVGSRNNNTAFKNLTKTPVTIVTSDWNKIVVSTEAFGVSGHLRLQACGEGRKQRKLTWVRPYEKGGYVRGLKKKV